MAALTGHTKSNGMASSNLRVIELDIAMDNSYPTGGESIAALNTLLADKTIVACVDYVVDVGGVIRKFRVNKTTKLVQAFTNLDVEVANGVDLSGYTSVKPVIFVE